MSLENSRASYASQNLTKLYVWSLYDVYLVSKINFFWSLYDVPRSLGKTHAKRDSAIFALSMFGSASGSPLTSAIWAVKPHTGSLLPNSSNMTQIKNVAYVHLVDFLSK